MNEWMGVWKDVCVWGVDVGLWLDGWTERWR